MDQDGQVRGLVQGRPEIGPPPFMLLVFFIYNEMGLGEGQKANRQRLAKGIFLSPPNARLGHSLILPVLLQFLPTGGILHLSDG